MCSYDDAMCAAVIEGGTPIVTYDAREDERFSSNPFVTGDLGNVRFYASHPLTSPEGVTVGTLCVFDEKPRHLDIDQAGMISDPGRPGDGRARARAAQPAAGEHGR